VTRTAYVTVVVPVIALALGSVVRHERLTAVSLAGTALIFVGLFFGMNLGLPRPATGRP
jgi:drug/metabolite transporter (DMT)-like permease